MPARLRSALVPYGIALVCVAIAVPFRLLFDPVLGDQLPFATIFLAVVVTSWVCGLRPALFSVALGGIAAEFFLLQPRFSFGMPSVDELYGLAFFAIIGLGISLLGGHMHEAKRQALESARSNRRNAALIDQTYDAVIVWDWGGPITFWNRGAERMYGYTREEASGMSTRALLKTAAGGNATDFLEALERNGEWEGELLHTRRDGQVIDVESRMVVIREDGMVSVLETVRNVTERKRTERDLREANDRLEARVRERTAELAGAAESLRIERDSFAKIVSTVPGAICSFQLAKDDASRFPFASPRLEDMFGIPAQVLERDASPLFERIHPDDVDEVRNAVIESARTMSQYNRAYRYRHPTRGEIWIEVHSIPSEEPDGSILWYGFASDVTDRIRAEKTLRDNERLLRLVTANARVGLVVIGKGYRHLFANEAYCEILHLEPGDVVGRPVPELLPHAWSGIQSQFDRAFAGERVEHELNLPPPPGETNIRSVSVVFEPLLDSGDESSVVGVLVDVTERKRSVDALRESEERFRQIAEGINEVFWLSDPVSNSILYVSPAYESIWGRTCESLVASPMEWLEFVHPDDRPRVKQAAENHEATDDYDVEYRIVRPDDSIRWIHDRGFMIRDAAGAVCRVGGVAEDVTERRMAEDASLQQQRRLAGIVDSAMDGIVTIDSDHRVLLINAAAERMFGHRAEDVVGRNVECLIPERFRPQHAGLVRAYGQTGVAARSMGSFGPITGLRADGTEFPIEASISQIEVEERKLFTVTCRDMTERMRAAEANRILEAQLHQSQKMEAFGQLAGGVAHDFNNLLTIIDGYSDMLLRTLPSESPDRSYVLEIRQAGARAAALTRQLLAFSRQQVLEPKILELNEVVADTEKMLRRLIGEDVHFETALRPDIATVKADPGQIVQVIMNLVVNARDAMPTGGKLRIETADVEIGEDAIDAHDGAHAGAHVMIAISDTGVGMPPDVAARVFEPFFTTKGLGKGTGLGLAVVDGIVRQSGGFIEVTSEPGVGTTFRVYLPAALEPADLSEEPARSSAPRGSETVLLVEDDESVQRLAALALREFGYRVLTASCGKEALRVMSESEADVRILVTDVVMPEMNGREIAEFLIAKYPTLKVLFVSGYTDDAVVHQGVEHSSVAFLRKPFTPGTLAAKVREVLDSD